MRYILFFILLGLIAFGIYSALVIPGDVAVDTPSDTDIPSNSIGGSIFSSDAYRFSPDLTKEGFTFVEEDGKTGIFAAGQSFMVPVGMTAGTNLSQDSRIHVQVTTATTTGCDPGTMTIPGNYERLPAKAGNGDQTFAGARSVEPGAGNIYDTTVYTVQRGGMCYTIIKFVHSGNIYNYDPGTVREFDAAAIEAYYDRVIRTFSVRT